MKTTLFFLFGTLLLLASCNQNSNDNSEEPESIPIEREAAQAYSQCYHELALKREEAEKANSSDELMDMVTELQDMATKASECEKSWRKMYDGQIDSEIFKKELKAINPQVYEMADELGAL